MENPGLFRIPLAGATGLPKGHLSSDNDDPLLLENALCATRRGSMTVGVLGLSVQDRCHRAVKFLISSYDIDSEIGDLKKYFILC